MPQTSISNKRSKKGATYDNFYKHKFYICKTNTRPVLTTKDKRPRAPRCNKNRFTDWQIDHPVSTVEQQSTRDKLTFYLHG